MKKTLVPVSSKIPCVRNQSGGKIAATKCYNIFVRHLAFVLRAFSNFKTMQSTYVTTLFSALHKEFGKNYVFSFLYLTAGVTKI